MFSPWCDRPTVVNLSIIKTKMGCLRGEEREESEFSLAELRHHMTPHPRPVGAMPDLFLRFNLLVSWSHFYTKFLSIYNGRKPS